MPNINFRDSTKIKPFLVIKIKITLYFLLIIEMHIFKANKVA